MRVALLFALLLGLTLAAPASAAYHGSNGMVAYVADGGALMVDDPYDDEPAAAIAEAATHDQSALAPESPPVWSPDGTKLLFTKAIPNGNIPHHHSAVFVINRDGTGEQQVSQPFPGKVESCGTCKDEETAWDVQPAWRDDDTVAFIRWVAAGDNAEHEAQEGTTVRRVELSGGGESVLRHYPNENNEGATGLIWPNTWSEPLIIHVEASGITLRKVSTNQVLVSGPISDVDASPDGQKLAYVALGAGGPQVTTISASGAPIDSFDPGYDAGVPSVRFTPDNNGLLLTGCAEDGDGVEGCGLVTHRLPDPDADVRPDEPLEQLYLRMNPADVADPKSVGTRAMLDIQSQDLPVIYVPGFLGSEIECDGERVWMPSAPPLHFAPMRLEADGLTNKTCPSARPTGKIVDTFLNFDVYEHADTWLAKMNPAGGYASFGWDWRKPPQESLDELDALIDELLVDKELLVAQGANRVSLVGHSYGALLMRTYIDDAVRAKRVARMLTVGAPYWGSPKPLFSIAFGVELPSFSSIDMMADNDDLRAFAKDMPGAYHLMPSDNYGPWLRYEGDQLDQAGVADRVALLGGNQSLLEQAWATHRDHVDGFEDHAGRIDYRSVTGVGFLTIGGVDLIDLAAEGEGLTARVRYENGDGTVTARSATQGPVGTADPLGDDIAIQYRCGYSHMDQTKDATSRSPTRSSSSTDGCRASCRRPTASPRARRSRSTTTSRWRCPRPASAPRRPASR